MTDTPEHIMDLHWRLWLEKPIAERFFRTIKDIEQVREVSRELRRSTDLPGGDLDPVREQLKKNNLQPHQL